MRRRASAGRGGTARCDLGTTGSLAQSPPINRADDYTAVFHFANDCATCCTLPDARCVLDIQQRHGSFSEWVWGFAGPGGAPVVNRWTELSQVPASTPASERLSKALKEAGFTFVGPTTCYSFMQAAGLVNDHLVGCFCHRECCDASGSGGGGGGGGGATGGP
ncbi:MAG: Methyladenine glycosylase-domain-containing protein [Monoraphidium minutum]|nr:MAG: Methyladenine glycosylase-domain-containing protein [Monoraphidium minutum]